MQTTTTVASARTANRSAAASRVRRQQVYVLEHADTRVDPTYNGAIATATLDTWDALLSSGVTISGENVNTYTCNGDKK